MRDLKSGIDIIKEFEGLYLKAYLDPVKIPTIGWGTIKYPDGSAVKIGHEISKAQAEEYLMHEVNQIVDRLEKLIKFSINDNAFAALVSFVYNVGITAFSESTLFRRLKSGESISAVASEFDRWNKAGGNVLAGLVRRRKSERALFEKPMKPSSDVPVEQQGPESEMETPKWFEPFKKWILALVEKLFGAKGESGVIAEPPVNDVGYLITKENPHIDARAISAAMKWKDNPAVKNKSYIVLVDFNKSEKLKREHVIDMKTFKSKDYKVAHGKNSDPNQDGLPTEFSNAEGSFKSSLGAMVIKEKYASSKFKYARRILGLEKGLNDNVAERAIVWHSSLYVNDIEGKLHGDSLGCFAHSEATAKELTDMVEGCLLYAWDDSLIA